LFLPFGLRCYNMSKCISCSCCPIPQEAPVMSIEQFLMFLAGAGGAAAAFAFIAERVPAFQAVPSHHKSLVVLAGSLVIALAAWSVLAYVPAATLDEIAPVFQIVYGVAGAWIASQVAHKADAGGKQ